MADKYQVISLHEQFPEWNSCQIAAHLNCSAAYVRATARRNGLKLPRKTKPRSKEDLLAEAARLIRRAETAPSEKDRAA